MYKELKKVLTMAFKDDDMMNQETLFDLQDYVADLTLKVAEKENKVEDLVKDFAWLYQPKED
jgi:hypothetical protein